MQEEGIDYDEVFAPVAKIEAIEGDFFGLSLITGFYSVSNGCHKCLYLWKMRRLIVSTTRAWYATLSAFLLKNGYRRGTIDKTLFLKKDKKDIILFQVYVDDIIFGSTKKSWCDEFEALMKSRFQMSSMGELTFFLGLPVKQKEDGIFISQDKYVAEILKKFDFASVKTASTTKLNSKAFSQIIVAGKPKLGLWYPRVSTFDVESYSDSDYAGANLDRKSITGGCQYLGRRLISWQCKKQTIMATSTTEVEYVAAASCCGQVLWIQNQITMADLDSCPKNNMVAYLEKSEGNAKFHEIIDFLKRSSIHHALTLPTSEVLIETTTDSSPAQTSEVPFEHQTNLSLSPLPIPLIPDSIPKTSGENLRGHSSSDKSFSRTEGEMTLQSVYDICLSLCAQVSDQAKEIQQLKSQITKFKKQAKPVIKHQRAWLKSVSLKQRFPSKSVSKKHRVHKEYVSKQGRKFAKGESLVQRDPLFDEVPEDTANHMETKNAQDEGRTREMVDEDKEIDEKILSTEDVLSTDKEGVSTDMEKVSTDRPIVSTNGSKLVLTAKNEGTKERNEVSKEKEKGVELKDVEETDRPRPTSTRSLLTLKPLPKIDPKDKGKNKIEEEDESESESDGIPKAEKKFKQLESDEEMARKIQEEWEGEEERNRIAEEKAANEALIRNFDDIKARIEADRLLAEKLQEQEREELSIEERAKFLHDTIATQRKFLAQQRSEAVRNRPPTKNQLRNQMMTYLKHVGNFKHVELKIKKFEEVTTFNMRRLRGQMKILSSIIWVLGPEDERLIKKINEKGVDSSKSEVLKEETMDRRGHTLVFDESSEGRVLWGDLMVMFKPDDENEFWNSQLDWIIMLKLKLESEEDSTMALELIRFIKKLLGELEPEE
ncbi:putative ribonuclease H-like domain-containing protein [Tanacetum coccineum]